MIIDIIYQHGGEDWAYKAVFSEIRKYYESNVKDHTINIKSSNQLNTQNEIRSRYGPYYMSIQNAENKKYFLISYWDKISDVKMISDFDNCVELFTSSGAHIDDYYYEPIRIKYTPFSYVCTLSENEKIIDTLFHSKNDKIFPDKLSFRGHLYHFREYLKKDNRYDVTEKKILDANSYFEILNRSIVSLSLNGAGEICNRDIELFGLGIAVIRPQLVTKFHNELIENYHYISIPTNDIDKTNINEYYRELSDRIIHRYEQVKKDIDYVKFVGENARRWYEENGTVSANVKILTEILDINKLK